MSKDYEHHTVEETEPLRRDTFDVIRHPSDPKESSRKWKSLIGLLFASTTINIALLLSNTLAWPSWTTRHNLSPYAQLARDLPVKYNSHSPFGLGSATEAERAVAWESLDSSAGEISLDKIWAKVRALPRSATFFWDDSRDIYLLNAHHSLHCMRKVRRSIVLYNYGRPQLDSYTHLVHCMDHLLQNIICEADDTPFYTSTTSNITTGQNQVRMCRSWDKLTAWANKQQACFSYINETQGVNDVIDCFRYCPKDSPLLKPMREYFGYPEGWFEERPRDIDTLPRYWEGLDM
ncbi:hypothetical protein BU23DRAFT_521757 [Bimuria novae-zelandiae CBS 107.79]|uniref:Tat pathway signal sequence n=1 Tax=Bimuria novae-zelandiae CBS 107.79 TaxID=1447943 RepID=A0A6A5UJG7_9PLEO|nr:hypothetical protein BU23DRAFT_521757 [Bimuria novae-zelandiae CBS 107.79]